jgi:hypothetical protein
VDEGSKNLTQVDLGQATGFFKILAREDLIDALAVHLKKQGVTTIPIDSNVFTEISAFLQSELKRRVLADAKAKGIEPNQIGVVSAGVHGLCDCGGGPLCFPCNLSGRG